MPSATGRLDWRVLGVKPTARDPLPAFWVVGFDGDRPEDSGPSWRYEPDSKAQVAMDAAAFAANRNARETEVRVSGGAMSDATARAVSAALDVDAAAFAARTGRADSREEFRRAVASAMTEG